MKRKTWHHAALTALVLLGLPFSPAYAVDLSAEEAAVERAKDELITAQNNLIKAQQALIAKQQQALRENNIPVTHAHPALFRPDSTLPAADNPPPVDNTSNYEGAGEDRRPPERIPQQLTLPARPVELPIEEKVPAPLQEAVLPSEKNVSDDTRLPLTKKLPPAYTKADIEEMIARNHGVLAKNETDIYTTEAAVPFTFTGFSRPESVRAVLDALAEVHGRATFFATEGEMRKDEASVRAVLDAGQELALCIYPKPSETVADICADILRGRALLSQKYGVQTTLVKQFSGAIRKETREAAAATGSRLIGASVNAVQSRHKDYQRAEQILPEVYSAGVPSATRGGIINIRMDWYTKPDLAAELFLYIKRKKIDNIAYNGFGDVSGVNPANDSAYQLRSLSDILGDREHLWNYPVPPEDYLPQLKRTPLISRTASHDELVDVLSQHYIGEPTVKEDRTLGFAVKDFEKLDLTGCIKTDEPVIFLTFDDWAYDDSINKLLYVLRKHNVPATFFVLTHNMIYNPNLLRAIAMEGHDIGSHTNLHKPMSSEDEKTGKQVALESYEEYYNDVDTSYKRLESVLGDLAWQDGSPVLTKILRPPTLSISEMGVRAILENGFDYIVDGHKSTEDYAAPDLVTEIKRIRDGLYYHGKVRKGAIFVMHMTESAKYTPYALDVILTENEKKADDDPTKFRVGQLSQYLTNGYSQAKTPAQLKKERRQIKWWQ